MSEQVGSVTRKKSSDFHGGIRFQSSFTIRWELEDKNFHKIDICLDYSLKYRIMATKTNESFTPFSNSVTFRKPRASPRATDLVVSLATVFSIVTQGGGALRDDTKNGCEGDYRLGNRF